MEGLKWPQHGARRDLLTESPSSDHKGGLRAQGPLRGSNSNYLLGAFTHKRDPCELHARGGETKHKS
jgi:hypothetical protein